MGDDFIGLAFGSAPVTMSWLDRIVCGIVGIAGIYAIYLLFKGTNSEVA